MLITRDQFGQNDRYLRKCHHTLSRFLKKQGIKRWGDVNINIIETFIKRRIQYWAATSVLKPYKIVNLKVHIVNILNFHTGEISIIAKNRIRNTICAASRDAIENSSYTTKRAKTFELDTINNAIEWLNQNESWVDRAAAVILAICFCTGSRVADALRIRKNRIIWTENASGKYITIRIQTSKNNSLGEFPEQLTYKIGSSNIINLDQIIKNWLTDNGSGTTIFENKEHKINAKIIINRFRKVSKALGLHNTITGHSGRNTMILQLYRAGVDRESMIMFMRWRSNSQMPIHYRQLMLEDTVVGGAYQLFMNNFNITE